MLAAGAMGVTCAKVGEAEAEVAAGVQGYSIANQVVTRSKITRLVNLQPHADVKVAVDNVEIVTLTSNCHSQGCRSALWSRSTSAWIGLGCPLAKRRWRWHVMCGNAGRKAARFDDVGKVTRRWKMPTPAQGDRKMYRVTADTAAPGRQNGLEIEIVSVRQWNRQVTPFIKGVTEKRRRAAQSSAMLPISRGASIWNRHSLCKAQSPAARLPPASSAMRASRPCQGFASVPDGA